MKIIDAHHHLWAPQTPALDVGYVWLKDIGAMKPFGDPTPIQRDYLLDEFLGEPAPRTLAGSVHLQVDPRIPDPVAETAFIQTLSDASDHDIMIIAYADLASSKAPEVIKQHKAYPNMRGLRQIISHLSDRPDISFVTHNLMDDLVWQANFAGLAQEGLSFDLMLYPEQMAQAADVLVNNPDVPVVIEHLGSPYDTSPKGLKRWKDGMQALAALPHVHAKLSGYAMYFRGDLTGAAIEVTQEIMQMFGPDRVMFGSNFPVDKLYLTYEELLTFTLTQTDPATHTRIMADNAERFYRFA